MATKKKEQVLSEGAIRKQTREKLQSVQVNRDMADKTEEYFQRMGAEKIEGGLAEFDQEGNVLKDEEGKIKYTPDGNAYYGVFLENGFNTPGSHKYVVKGDDVTIFRKIKKADKKGVVSLEEVKVRTAPLHDIRAK